MKHTTRLLIVALAMWTRQLYPLNRSGGEFTYNGDTGPGNWSDLEEAFRLAPHRPRATNLLSISML